MAQPSVPSFVMITAQAMVLIVPRAKPSAAQASGDRRRAMVAGTDDIGTRPVDQAGVPEHRVDLADAGLQPVAEQDLQSRVMTLPFSELARSRPRTRPFSWVGRHLSWPGAGHAQR